MKNEYDDLAESEQFGVVVSKKRNTQPHNSKKCVFVKSIYFHFSSDLDMINHKYSRENQRNKK